jgi:hypothetical protein
MKGSMTEKGSSEWLIRAYSERVDSKAAHVNRTVHGNKRDAQKALAKLITDLSSGNVTAGQTTTVEQLQERWLDDIAPQRTLRTVFEYRRPAKRHIVPPLGTKRIDRLTAREIDAYCRSLLARGLSPASVRRQARTPWPVCGATTS